MASDVVVEEKNKATKSSIETTATTSVGREGTMVLTDGISANSLALSLVSSEAIENRGRWQLDSPTFLSGVEPGHYKATCAMCLHCISESYALTYCLVLPCLQELKHDESA